MAQSGYTGLVMITIMTASRSPSSSQCHQEHETKASHDRTIFVIFVSLLGRFRRWATRLGKIKWHSAFIIRGLDRGWVIAKRLGSPRFLADMLDLLSVIHAIKIADSCREASMRHIKSNGSWRRTTRLPGCCLMPCRYSRVGGSSESE